jgi:hypothetical protein
MQSQAGTLEFTPAQMASVLGHYDVLAVVAGRHSDVDGLVGDLAAISDEGLLGKRYGWVVKNRERLEILSAIDAQAVPRLLAATEQLVFKRDDYAEALRATLKGRLPISRPIGPEALAALRLAVVLPALAAERDSFEQEILRIEDKLLVDRERASLEFVISNRLPLVGRDRELNDLISFATSGEDQATTVLSGDAGVGKSALLATLIRTLTKSGDAITVVLDFDGPQLASAEPAEFLREFSRRLASAAIATDLLTIQEKTALTINMKSLRSRIRSRSSEQGNVRRVSSEEQYRGVDAYAAEAFANLPQALKTKPILLVLDTFEVALAAGEVEIDRLLTIVMLLRFKFNLPSLRAIVAGRSLAGQLTSWTRISQDVLAPRERWLVLSALRPRAAERMIANLDRNEGRFENRDLRRRAAKVAGYYPLSLKLVHQATRGMQPNELSAFLDDVKGSENFVDEMNTQFLHARILGRIEDTELRKLAAPGLLLRLVSPDLIRLVLAGPCGLGTISAARSSELYGKLKKTWLVDEPGESFSRHRDDLRRQMVSAITAESPQKANDLHRAAASFYLAGPPGSDPAMSFWKNLSPDVRDAEGVYHAAFAGETYPQTMPQQEARSLKKHLGLDLELLPDGWIAVIRAAAGDISTLTSEQVATLSGSLRDEAVSKEINRLLTVNDSEAAARMVNLGSARYDGGFTAAPSPRLEGTVSVPLLRRDLHQRILVAWANAAIDEAANAFEQLVETETDPISGLLEALPDAVKEDSRSLSAGVLAASLKKPWRTSALGLSTVPPLLAAPYLAARMLLAHDSLFKKLLRELRDSSMLRQILEERGAPVVHHRLKSWIVAMRIATGDDINREEQLPKEFLDLKAILLLGASNGTPGEMELSSVPDTAQAIELLQLGPTSARIEDVYRTDDFLNLDIPSFEGDRAELLELLRGLTPELHRPAAFLLRRAPTDQLIGFIREQSATNTLWPRDQAFETERSRRSFAERDALSVVVTCDRLRLLPALLIWLSRYQDEASDLLAMHQHITARLFTEFDIKPLGRVT